jgi:hypothetical protein
VVVRVGQRAVVVNAVFAGVVQGQGKEERGEGVGTDLGIGFEGRGAVVCLVSLYRGQIVWGTRWGPNTHLRPLQTVGWDSKSGGSPSDVGLITQQVGVGGGVQGGRICNSEGRSGSGGGQEAPV